jgi:hypothetical protein
MTTKFLAATTTVQSREGGQSGRKCVGLKRGRNDKDTSGIEKQQLKLN